MDRESMLDLDVAENDNRNRKKQIFAQALVVLGVNAIVLAFIVGSTLWISSGGLGEDVSPALKTFLLLTCMVLIPVALISFVMFGVAIPKTRYAVREMFKKQNKGTYQQQLDQESETVFGNWYVNGGILGLWYGMVNTQMVQIKNDLEVKENND
jgi:hypothetical protein